MNAPPPNPGPMASDAEASMPPLVQLSHQQIENLQGLVKQFKTLSKRYGDSKGIQQLLGEHQSLSHSAPSDGSQMVQAQAAPTGSVDSSSSAAPNQFVNPVMPPNLQAPGLQLNHFNSAPVSFIDLSGGVQQPLLQQVSNSMGLLSASHSHAYLPKANPVASTTEGHASRPHVSGTPSALTAQSSSSSALALSWQCFHSLLFYGVGKGPGDGSVAFSMADVGCFSKGSHLPLVVNALSTATMKEELLKLAINSNQLDHSIMQDNELILIQREIRATIAKQFIDLQKRDGLLAPVGINAINNSSHFADLSNYTLFSRPRKSSKKDNRVMTSDERRRREQEERKKKRQDVFHRHLLEHRESFSSFHRHVKAEAGKTARAVKQAAEIMLVRRERGEQRLEALRLQALKENNMEEYQRLVAETKNGRIQFLLSETDNYISTIKHMIEEQRAVVDLTAGGTLTADNLAAAAAGGAASSSSAAAAATDEKLLETDKETAQVKDYYRSTHKRVELVSQPRMLKGGDLKEYQLAGLQWMVSLYNNGLNGILADEMGLGKTIQTIALLSYLMENKGNNGPFMVIVPLSTLSNWVNEFNKWAPSIIKVVYKGSPDGRKKIVKEEIEPMLFNALVTTYEFVIRDKAALRKINWQYIIVDEGHRMKNAQSKFAQTLAATYTSQHRLLLTGTPLQNNLPELWALLNFLLPSIFSSVDTFDAWFNKPFAAFKTGKNNVPEEELGGVEDAALSQEERMLIVHRLHELLRPFMLRRVKDQVLDQVPSRVEKVVKCPLSALQLRMYHSIISKGLNKEGGHGGLNNTIMQLRKVCNHPFLFLKDYLIDEELVRSAGKFELLNRMLPKLKAAGHRVLLFSQMVEVLNHLEQLFALRGFLFLRLDGGTSSEERERRMFAFNDPNSPYFVFLLSTRAGGLGLNLATADTVIIFDSDWNPMMDAQAQGRAHRIGQKNEVRVFRIITHSPIEEKILSRATEKLNLTELVVEAGNFNSRVSASLEDNKEMMESLLNEYSAAGAESLQRSFGDYEAYLKECDGVVDEEELNLLMASYDGEYELYQSLDERLQPNGPQGLAANLLGAGQLPRWMNDDSWHPKYLSLMDDVMHPKSSTLGAGGAVTVKSSKKKRERLSGEFPSNDAFGDDDMDDEPEGFALRKRTKEVRYDDGLSDIKFAKLLERQADEAESKPKVPKRGIAHLDAATQSLIKALQEITKLKRDNGTLLAQYFLEKPSRLIFPDYYQVIPQPMSLKEILAKLKQGEYDYFESIELDFALMADNARIFNTENSEVFQLCESVRAEFYKKSQSILTRNDIMPLGGGKTMPPLPRQGCDIYLANQAFTGLLNKAAALPAKKKAKAARQSGSVASSSPMKHTPSNLSLKLSLGGGSGRTSELGDYADDQDEDEDQEEDASGLVLSFSKR